MLKQEKLPVSRMVLKERQEPSFARCSCRAAQPACVGMDHMTGTQGDRQSALLQVQGGAASAVLKCSNEANAYADLLVRVWKSLFWIQERIIYM